jgi:hypothetical protein
MWRGLIPRICRLHPAQLAGDRLVTTSRPRLPPYPPLDVLHRVALPHFPDILSVYAPDIPNAYDTLKIAD